MALGTAILICFDHTVLQASQRVRMGCHQVVFGTWKTVEELCMTRDVACLLMDVGRHLLGRPILQRPGH